LVCNNNPVTTFQPFARATKCPIKTGGIEPLVRLPCHRNALLIFQIVRHWNRTNTARALCWLLATVAFNPCGQACQRYPLLYADKPAGRIISVSTETVTRHKERIITYRKYVVVVDLNNPATMIGTSPPVYFIKSIAGSWSAINRVGHFDFYFAFRLWQSKSLSHCPATTPPQCLRPLIKNMIALTANCYTLRRKDLFAVSFRKGEGDLVRPTGITAPPANY